VNFQLIFSGSDPASLLTRTGDALSLHAMDPPLLSVGKSDVVIEIFPPALRFWEKLGLTPRGGAKNVTSYVFFEEQEDDKIEHVSRWLDRVSAAYSVS
jgi:mediator of RNA polymerase II transcription subunit 13, fungi type